jgi:threonine/homoserine/homoserine lactone efflux protein
MKRLSDLLIIVFYVCSGILLFSVVSYFAITFDYSENYIPRKNTTAWHTAVVGLIFGIVGILSFIVSFILHCKVEGKKNKPQKF